MLVIQGSNVEAEVLYTQVVEAETSSITIATDDTLAARAKVGLGELLWETCRLKEAEECLRSVLLTPFTSSHTMNLLQCEAASMFGMLMWYQKRLEEAESLYNKTLQNFDVDQLEYNRIAVHARYLLAIIHLESGRWNLAKTGLLESYEKRIAFLGPNNTDTCKSANALGHLLTLMGAYENSIKYLEIAQVGQDHLQLGSANAASLHTLFNLGVLDREQGLYQESFQTLGAAVRLREKAYGKNHKSTLIAQAEFATLMLEMGQAGEALDLLSRVVATFRTEFDNRQGDALRAELIFGNASLACGKVEDAESVLLDLLPRAETCFGTDHPDFLKVRFSIGQLYLAKRDDELAEELLDVLLKQLKSTLGDDHISSLRCQGLLGRVMFRNGA